MYWWTEDIAEVRTTANAARRRLLRARKRLRGGAETEETERLRRAHKESKNALRKRIRRAKHEAWVELVRSVEQDPWGRPYRAVLGPLRAVVAPLTTTMTKNWKEH